jgi:hypothetical protein
LCTYPTPETLVVVDLWFIENKWRKGTLDYREKGLWRLQRYVLDAKGNVIPGKAPNLLSQ